LIAVLACIGLLISTSYWEHSFDEAGQTRRVHTADHSRHKHGESPHLSLLITALALAALFFKYYFKRQWSEYKNPVAFHKQLIMKKVELGYIDQK
jgi:hypothetical protein